MSTETQAISDDILKAAWDAAGHVYSPDDSPSSHSYVRDIIAKAIHDAVMAERERWSPASIYFERYCQDEADAAENCISEQQHIDAKALAAVVRGEG